MNNPKYDRVRPHWATSGRIGHHVTGLRSREDPNVVLPVAAMVAAIVAFAEPLLGFAFEDFYGAAAPLVALLVGAELANAAAGSCGEVLIMTGHQRRMIVIAIATGVFAIGGSLLVVDHFGILGIACVLALGTVLQNVLMLVTARRTTGMWTYADVPGAVRQARRHIGRRHAP